MANQKHKYPGIVAGRFEFTSDCAYGCGAWMGGSRSGAPDGIDPFGECPEAPERPEPSRKPEGDAGQRKRWPSVEEFIDDCGMTCDCCQHVMIDVTAVMNESEKQHCITGDPEGEGAACSWGITHDLEMHAASSAEAERELLEMCNAAAIALRCDGIDALADELLAAVAKYREAK